MFFENIAKNALKLLKLKTDHKINNDKTRSTSCKIIQLRKKKSKKLKVNRNKDIIRLNYK